MLKVCYYSILLKTQDSSPYNTYNCSSCCINKHIYMYIEYLYVNKIVHRKIERELHNENCNVRYAAILYQIKMYGYTAVPYFLINDPFYKIRKLCIQILKTEDWVDYLDDMNTEIVVKTLEVLYKKNCEYHSFFEKDYTFQPNKLCKLISCNNETEPFLEILCKKLTRLMTHQNDQVRIYASKSLSMLYKLDSKFFMSMLCKNTKNEYAGAIVYGLEDECSVIRKNTIISLYTFFINFANKSKENLHNKNVLAIVIEYFINTINDEDLEVRNTAIYLFHQITKNEKIKLTGDNISQISYNITESTVFSPIDFHVLGIFQNIKFKSFKIIVEIKNKLIDKLDTKCLVITLYKMFNNNISFTKKMHTTDIFAEQEQELINKEFVVLILINYVLKETCDIQINKTMEKYLPFIDILIRKQSLTDAMKENLLLVIQNKKHNNIFCSKGVLDDFTIFLNMFYKGLIRKNISGLLMLNQKFNNVNLTTEILHDNIRLKKYIECLNSSITKK